MVRIRVSLAALSLLAASPALAQEPPASDTPEVALARRHYSQGVVFFRAERYEEAIAEFEEARRLWANPTILYSLGQANERLLRVPRAIALYRQFLEEAPPDAPNRDLAEASIEGLSALLATLTIESNVPAKVYANGDEIGEAPGTIEMATGEYQIELRAPGYETMTQPVRIAARSERSLSFTLVRVQGGERVVVRERRSGLHPIWFWIGTAVTGVSGVSGIVLGVVTIGKSSDIEADPLPNTDDRDSGERLALLTDIAFGGMIVFGTASLLLYLNTDWGEGEDASEHARLAPGLSIGPDHAVLSLGGSL